MKKSHNKNIPLYLTLGAILLGLFFFFQYEKLLAPRNEISVAPDTISIRQDDNLNNNLNAATNNIKNIPNMPILMYHYIRVVDDPNDTLGKNLSVVPEKFAEQLDYIQNLGYQTTNFRKLEDGIIPDKPIILTFDDGYQDFYDKAYPELKKRGMTAIIYVIAGKNGGEYLNNQEIKELSDNGFEVGSHTLFHSDLTKVSEEKAKIEIQESKSDLEAIIGTPILSFCYPAGKYSDKTIQLVSDSGYLFATTTNPGIANFLKPLELARHRMNAETNINSYIK